MSSKFSVTLFLVVASLSACAGSQSAVKTDSTSGPKYSEKDIQVLEEFAKDDGSAMLLQTGSESVESIPFESAKDNCSLEPNTFFETKLEVSEDKETEERIEKENKLHAGFLSKPCGYPDQVVEAKEFKCLAFRGTFNNAKFVEKIKKSGFFKQPCEPISDVIKQIAMQKKAAEKPDAPKTEVELKDMECTTFDSTKFETKDWYTVELNKGAEKKLSQPSGSSMAAKDWNFPKDMGYAFACTNNAKGNIESKTVSGTEYVRVFRTKNPGEAKDLSGNKPFAPQYWIKKGDFKAYVLTFAGKSASGEDESEDALKPAGPTGKCDFVCTDKNKLSVKSSGPIELSEKACKDLNVNPTSKPSLVLGCVGHYTWNGEAIY